MENAHFPRLIKVDYLSGGNRSRPHRRGCGQLQPELWPSTGCGLSTFPSILFIPTLILSGDFFPSTAVTILSVDLNPNASYMVLRANIKTHTVLRPLLYIGSSYFVQTQKGWDNIIAQIIINQKEKRSQDRLERKTFGNTELTLTH